MFVKGKIEVFKNKKGYPTGVIKSFDTDNKLVGKMCVACNFKDKELVEKMSEGKTYTVDVKVGYLDVRHIELEQESLNILVISIAECEVVKVFPEEKPAKKTTKKTTKSSK